MTTRKQWVLALAIVLLPAETMFAQEVKAVVSAGDFLPGIAPVGIASAFGSSLSRVTGSATRLPLPTNITGNGLGLCDLTLDPNMTDCSALQLFFVSPSQINFALPGIGTASLSHRFVVRPAFNGQWSGATFSIAVQSFAPRIFWVGYDCLTDTRFAHPNVNCGLTTVRTNEAFQSDRGAVSDQNGIVLTSAHRAKLGQAYTIWMTGLGLSQNGSLIHPPALTITDVPAYGYSGDTYIYAPLLFAGPSPQYQGLYQLNFILPTSIAGSSDPGNYPLFPCGDYDWEVSLDIIQGTGFGETHANLVQIPIHVTRGDVPCTP